ncbi:MAG: hypothetical protein JSU74_03875 [Candidatus Zixiibacteriota bacterium]|nr:MAG: hypothetical protein JSU74_03875 [candidate division Zixibacteria bacterium]
MTAEKQAGGANIQNYRNWLVYFDQKVLSGWPVLRGALVSYFQPFRIESYRCGRLYRLLGVHWVAYVIPTGGLMWRRLFGWKGWSFALIGPSIRAASEYRYSTCVFEILHLSALVLMLPDGVRAFSHGCRDGILKFVLAGLIMNGYPLLLQRYNRVRIQHLLETCAGHKRGYVHKARRY